MNWAAWGVSWLGSWGNSWGPLHEVDEETLIGGGGSRPFKGKIPKTTDDSDKPIVYPKYHPWIHAPDDIKRELDKLVIEPEIAEAVVEVVAKTVEKRTAQNKDVETAQANKALREFLEGREQFWKDEYAQLIRLEYERREQEYEDAQIAMMLFEM